MTASVCPARLPIFTTGAPSDVPRPHVPEREDGQVIRYSLILHGLKDTVRWVGICELCGGLFRLQGE